MQQEQYIFQLSEAMLEKASCRRCTNFMLLLLTLFLIIYSVYVGLLISYRPELKIPKLDFSDDIKNIYNISLTYHKQPIYQFHLSNYSSFLNLPDFLNTTYQNITIPCDDWRCNYQPESYALQTFPKETWIQTPSKEYFYLRDPDHWMLLMQIFGLFVICNISALYSRITVWAAPMLMPLQGRCFCFQVDERLMLQMPNLSGYWQHSRKIWLALSFLGIWIIFYFNQVASSLFISSLMINKSYPEGFIELFSGLILMIEFLNYFFLRSRAAILFFPQTQLLLYIIIFVYFQFTVYGYYIQMTLWCILASTVNFLLMLKYIEIPQIFHNPNCKEVPHLHRPRMVYFPLFQLSYINDIPPLWTMLYPYESRSCFSEQQMYFIDENYRQLNQLIDPSLQEEDLVDPNVQQNQIQIDQNVQDLEASLMTQQNQTQDPIL